jgi:hypothetical protein
VDENRGDRLHDERFVRALDRMLADAEAKERRERRKERLREAPRWFARRYRRVRARLGRP